ncbi:b(0,+)-type amino acid transporter 1-like isoform X2 [Aphidius gifuensis]|uniref:b(0,+)-type amino acid transporter 1-like isoform X2 n=1 Tax=Aphidius gifuensis TaxID=684658 RepID=UPI001CDB6B07|nr:b(0,+)-type amino acid transporter 1-like isoform X2 [Aphidius gifuensis]
MWKTASTTWNIIGSGIFVSPTTALKESGSIGSCLIIWAACGFLSFLGALAFAELSTVVPRSGAEYAYLIEAFGPLHKYTGRLPAFICSWICVFLLRPAEVAVIILTFSEYFIQPLLTFMPDICPESLEDLRKIIGLLALGLITFINMTSVKLFVKVQNIFGICKVGACLIVIGGGISWLVSGKTELLADPFKGTSTSPGNIALAFYSGLWAYDGWTSATIVTEEVKKPEVNILRSILIAVPIITVLYVSMNLAYMSVLTRDEMIVSEAVAVDWAKKVLPPWIAILIPIGVAISTFGCALSVQFGISRLCHVAGQEGHVPLAFSFVHITRMTPAVSVILQGLISFICILVGNVHALIEFASFLTWVFYGLAMVALLIMRKTKPDAPRPYKVPIFIPWLVLFIAIFLAVTPIIHEPSLKYFFALIFIIIGVGVYHLFVYNQRCSKLSRKFTYFIQVLCQVAPSEIHSD